MLVEDGARVELAFFDLQSNVISRYTNRPKNQFFSTLIWCERSGSNRHGCHQPRDFKSLASTNFATLASKVEDGARVELAFFDLQSNVISRYTNRPCCKHLSASQRWCILRKRPRPVNTVPRFCPQLKACTTPKFRPLPINKRKASARSGL